MNGRRGDIRVWSFPIGLGMLSVLGLVSALLADGLGDIVSWIALAVPGVVAAWFTGRSR